MSAQEPSPRLAVGMSLREAAEPDRMASIGQELGADVCHLQGADPSLSRELTRLADAGATRIALIGVSLGALAPANSWLRRIAGHWWRERRTPRPEVAVATTLVRDESDLERDPFAIVRAIHGREAPLESAAWEDVPPFDRHVLLCRGPRCTARGAETTLDALRTELREQALGEDDVLLTQTGCLFPCNHAPVLTIHPDDAWYGGVDAPTARRIVTEHLRDGVPVADRRLPRHTDREIG